MKWLVLVCLVGVGLAFPSPIRSKAEIEELRQFLLKTKQDANITLEEAMARNPKASAWENSGKFQGDILLQDEEIEEMVAEYSGMALDRNGMVAPRHRWPGGVIYYQIDANFNNIQLDMIQWGLNIFHEHTCTRWVRRTNQRDYVLITGRQTGCYATVGYWQNSGVHTLNLANGCFNVMIIVHEMFHSAGFHHMHQTYNRYDWVWINWQNVYRGMEHNFDRFSNQVVTMLGLPYEYASNQHYGSHAFSFNGQPTIGARFSGGEQMGQLQFISGYDIWRLARLYNCPGAWSVEVRAEDINKPFDEDFDRRLKEAAAKELRERAEMLDRALEEQEQDPQNVVEVFDDIVNDE